MRRNGWLLLGLGLLLLIVAGCVGPTDGDGAPTGEVPSPAEYETGTAVALAAEQTGTPESLPVTPEPPTRTPRPTATSTAAPTVSPTSLRMSEAAPTDDNRPSSGEDTTQPPRLTPPSAAPSAITESPAEESGEEPGDNAETAVPVTFEPDSQAVASETAIIGDTTAFIFYENSAVVGQRTVIELQLFFDNVYITPTPSGPVQVIPGTQVGAPPTEDRPAVQPRATSTPRAAQDSESGIGVTNYLAAELVCYDLFADCGLAEARQMAIRRRNSFTWAVLPLDDGSTGPRRMQLRLYSATADGTVGARLWTYDFTLNVVQAQAAANPVSADDGDSGGTDLAGPLLLGGAALLLGGGAFFLLRRQAAASHVRPTVFISYKRDVSWGIARTIRDRLEEKGADVFIDVEDIHDGSFGEYIQQNIRERDYFVLVLAPGTLSSSWVRREAELALSLGKTVIPVLVNNFDLYGDEVPESLTALQEQNAVTLPPEYVAAGIDRIANFINLPG